MLKLVHRSIIVCDNTSTLGNCRSILITDDSPLASSAISFAAVCDKGASSDTSSISTSLYSVLCSLSQ